MTSNKKTVVIGIVACLVLMVAGFSAYFVYAMVFANREGDNFDSGNLDKWIIQSGSWSIHEKVLVNEASVSSSVRSVILFNTPVEQNYEITCKVLITERTAVFLPEAQIVIGYQDLQNYYFVGLGAYEHYVGIGRFTNGQNLCVAHSAETDSEIEPLTWYNMKITVAETTVTVFVNGMNVLTYDAEINGQIGLTGIFGTVYFNDFEVHLK